MSTRNSRSFEVGDRVRFERSHSDSYTMSVEVGETGTVRKVWSTDGTVTVYVDGRGVVRVFPRKLDLL